ncbi:hypothetical protein ANFP_23700 [Acidithiobacillus ferrooxidans]|nr:hypothetical protein ANFP_23700 [Acidithiobacillus ferrooxidans]
MNKSVPYSAVLGRLKNLKQISPSPLHAPEVALELPYYRAKRVRHDADHRCRQIVGKSTATH